MKAAKYWIEKLKLKKHPEGGFYIESYRAKESIKKEALPNRYTEDRSYATSIYFLLQKDDYSSFHRLKSDEIWHFYLGTTLELILIEHNGNLKKYLLGPDYEAGEHLQLTIPRNHWFAAKLPDRTGYALVGCTMAPGFHFDDFELANRESLIQQFPQHKELITTMTVD